MADRLASLAIHQADSANWVGLSLVTEREWQLRAAGIDLYSGTPGIILFLAYAGAVTGESRYTDLARQALRSLARQRVRLERLGVPPAMGAFSGLGSSVYLLSHLGALWSEPSLLDEAEKIAARLGERVADDKTFDIVAGAAGSALALLSLLTVRPSSGALSEATRCGEHLMRHAHAASRGVGWLNLLLVLDSIERDGWLAGRPSGLETPDLMTGLAGIGYQLLRLAHPERVPSVLLLAPPVAGRPHNGHPVRRGARMRRIRPILQMEATECGAARRAMLLN